MPIQKRAGIGIDIIEIQRVRDAVTRWQDSFLKRVYTPAELSNSGDFIPGLACRFAAKEATMKALGLGIGQISFHDIEVRGGGDKQPYLKLWGRAAREARKKGLAGFSVSLSHCREQAIAVVFSEKSI